VDGFPKAVPQRRRRVFLVGCLGDAQRAAQVLFERESVQRDSATRRKAREGTTPAAQAGVGTDVSATVTSKWEKGRGGPSGNEASNLIWWNGDDVASTLTAESNDQRMPDQNNFHAVVGTLCGSGAGCDRASGQHNELDFLVWPAQVSAALGLNGKGTPGCSNQEIFSQGASGLVPTRMSVRRLTTRECERLQQTVPIQDGREMQKAQNGLGIGQQGDPAYTLDTTGAQAIACINMQGSKSNACVAQDGSSYSLNAMHGHDVHAVAHAFYSGGGTRGVNQHPEVSPAVKVGSGLGIPSPPAVARAMTVRRLTPRECERLQGFPDDWTLIPWRGRLADQCPDGPRYKALGNSMAVNVMRWIGTRIEAFK